MRYFLIFSLLAATVLSQTTPKVIMWEDHSQGDPEFASRSQVFMQKKLNQISSFDFVGTDTLKRLAEERLFSWPINNNIIRDSMAQALQVQYQMTFQTNTYKTQVQRSALFFLGEELVSYQMNFQVREADSLLYQAEVKVDTIIDHGWCGLKDCKVPRRDSMEEIKIKTHLLNKGIQLLIIDAQPFFKEE